MITSRTTEWVETHHGEATVAICDYMYCSKEVVLSSTSQSIGSHPEEEFLSWIVLKNPDRHEGGLFYPAKMNKEFCCIDHVRLELNRLDNADTSKYTGSPLI